MIQVKSRKDAASEQALRLAAEAWRSESRIATGASLPREPSEGVEG